MGKDGGVRSELERRWGDGVWVSVVIATYNRPELLRRLLLQLDEQTVPAERYEVIAVDDESRVPVREALADLTTRYPLVIERQKNGGPQAARQTGVGLARGHVVVFIDDDMQVGPTFLEAHLIHHTDDRTAVLGRLLPDAAIASMPLFEKFFARMLEKKAARYGDAGETLHGSGVYTGNLSVSRRLFLDAGGFDQSLRQLEDEELGIRLEKAGGRLVFSNDASAINCSDKTETAKWLERSYRDGRYAVRVAKKHPDTRESSPWRHLSLINPVSKPFLGLAIVAPDVAHQVARVGIALAQAADKLGIEPLGIAGTTLVYGIEYYRGVHDESGGLAASAAAYREFRRGLAMLTSGDVGVRDALSELVSSVRADHATMLGYQAKFDARHAGSPSLVSDAVKKIGLQIMVAYRLMRFFRAAGLPVAAQLTSRLIRLAYGSDIHWDADLAPGVMIVHGFGLAISYAAKVDAGSVLFQNVTLGFGTDPETRATGAPHLERNVHVGIGATLFGPITVGESTKIMAGCVVSTSLPPRSLVESPSPQVRERPPSK